MNNNLDILSSYYFTLNKLSSQLNSTVVTGIAYDILSKKDNLDEESLKEITKKVISIAAVQDFYHQISNPEQNMELVTKLGASLVNHVNDLMDSEPQVKVSTAKGKYDHIDFKPPKSVADTAAAGLKARQKAPKSRKGGLSPQEAKKQGIGSGVTRAVTLKNRKHLSPSTIKRMFSFFSRHEKNKNTPRGRIAWQLWGGTPGFAFARKVVRQMEAADKKSKKKRKSKK